MGATKTQTPADGDNQAPAAAAPIDVAAITVVLIADDGFRAALIDAVLSNESFRAGVIDIAENAVANVSLTDRVKGEIEHQGIDLIRPMLIEELPDLVAAAMPETSEARDERQRREASKAADDRAEARNRADRKAAKDAERAASDEAARRTKQREHSRAQFDAATETRGGGDPIDLDQVDEALLLIDDGESFSIDVRPINVEPGKLSLTDDKAVLLTHDAIDLDGDGDTFVVRGVDLVLTTSAGKRHLRCELPSPLTIGGGARGRLSADSLLFRDR